LLTEHRVFTRSNKNVQLHAKVIKRSPTVGLTGVHNRRFVVTRFGDEEFAIILPETNADGARIVAENVRKRVEINLTRLQPTTVSLGITSLREGLLYSQVLVDQGDRALYQGKRQGRNRAVNRKDWMREPAYSDGRVTKTGNESPPENWFPD
jgi:predicted signal transduction protein with EAL and GGDEF domain